MTTKKTRREGTRFNSRSLRVETVSILTCPKCGIEEQLTTKRRQARVYTVKVTVSSLAEDKKQLAYTDLCSDCFSSLMRWFPLGDTPEEAED